jgi:hypothetical protein
VAPKNLVEFAQGELVQLDNLGPRSKERRNNEPGFLLISDLYDNPCLVFSVQAPEIRMRQILGAGANQDLGRKSTLLRRRLMRPRS